VKQISYNAQTGEVTEIEVDDILIPETEPQPTDYEVLRDYVLDLDFRLVMMELGL